MEFEHQILLFIQEHLRFDWLDPIMKCITFLGNAGWFFIALAAVLLVIPKTRKIGLAMGIALLLHLFAVNIGLKNIVGRIRPYDTYTDLIRIVKLQKDYSFPSGHTSAAIAASLALYLSVPKAQKKWGIALLVLSALIAYSRMYVGVHYPTDILGGIVTGVLCAVAGVAVCRKWIFRPEKTAGNDK